MSEDDVIDWHADEYLSWSDFKAEPHPGIYQDAVSKIKYRPSWRLFSQKMGKEVFFLITDINLKTQFLKNLSWVREKLASDQLLQHQQGFFDLAEELRPIITQKITQLFSDKKYLVRGSNDAEVLQFAQEDSGNIINDALGKLFNEIYLEEAQKYESATEFGENPEKQKSYNLRFSKLHSSQNIPQVDSKILEFVKNRDKDSESTSSRHIHRRFGFDYSLVDRILKKLERDHLVIAYFDKEYEEYRYKPTEND